MSPITTHDRVSAIQTYIIIIVLTIMLSELSAILIDFIHLLENHNSGSITQARFGYKLQWMFQGTLNTLRIAILHAM